MKDLVMSMRVPLSRGMVLANRHKGLREGMTTPSEG
jgi:hypothetical protein